MRMNKDQVKGRVEKTMFKKTWAKRKRNSATSSKTQRIH